MVQEGGTSGSQLYLWTVGKTDMALFGNDATKFSPRMARHEIDPRRVMDLQAAVDGDQPQFWCEDAGMGHDMWEQDAGYATA